MKHLQIMLFSVLSFFGLIASTAQAAVPAAVTTSLTDAGTDSIVIATAVLVILVGIAAYRYMKKAL